MLLYHGAKSAGIILAVLVLSQEDQVQPGRRKTWYTRKLSQFLKLLHLARGVPRTLEGLIAVALVLQ